MSGIARRPPRAAGPHPSTDDLTRAPTESESLDARVLRAIDRCASALATNDVLGDRRDAFVAGLDRSDDPPARHAPERSIELDRVDDRPATTRLPRAYAHRTDTMRVGPQVVSSHAAFAQRAASTACSSEHQPRSRGNVRPRKVPPTTFGRSVASMRPSTKR